MGAFGKRSTPERRVARGAAWLDRVKPDWYRKVDLEELDLGSSCSCVLGQICITEFAAHPAEVRAISYGTYPLRGDYAVLVAHHRDKRVRRQDIEIKKENLSKIDNLKNLVIPYITAKGYGFELSAAQERKANGMSAEYEVLTDFWKAAIIERRLADVGV